MRSAAARIALLLFASGLCALIYQISWLRMLRDIFGASTLASAAVLAIFMGGLGLGGLILGRRADREPSPLGFYARLEMGVALAAALSPVLVKLVQMIYLGLGGTARLGLAGGTAVRLVLATLVLALPTFLMGGTLPAAARAVERSTDAGRRAVGLLYAVNTLGAVVGILLATFVALEALGVRKTIWEAALLNLLVALAARSLARRMEAATPGTDPAVDRRGAGSIVPVAAGLVGFVFLLMELVWYRMLSPLLGGSSYTFGLILAVALLGIGLGGLLYAAGEAGRRPTLTAFAATCALEAAFLALPFALGDRLAVIAALLRPLVGAGFLPLVLGWSAVTVIAVLPAAAIAGYQFPLLIALLGSGRERVGREVGVTYAANTAGAILGSVAGGFGLMPLLTAPGLWRLSAGVLVVLAVFSAFLGLRQGGPRRAAVFSLATAAAALLLTLAPGPTAFWRHSPIGAGRVDVTQWRGPNDVEAEQRLRRQGILWEADGVESSVALDAGKELSFLVNGKADGSARTDAPTQIMGGLIGALLHPEPRRSLVIGLGTGSTAGWLAAVPTMERVDVVELEPSIVHVARAFTPVNHDVLRNPKVRLILGDGREVLLATDERYDIIFSEPSNPYRAGIASLFTADFYRAVRARLRPGGVFLQWLQGYELDARAVGIAYATLGSVFPSVETWEVNSGDLLLMAGERTPLHDVARVRARSATEPWRTALARTWGVAGAEGFYSGFLASGGFAREVAAHEAGWINTDDRPLLEFGFARNLGRAGLFRLPELAALAAARGAARPAVRGTLDWTRVEEMRAVRAALWSQKVPGPRPGLDPAAAARILARQAYAGADLGQACARWSSQPAQPVLDLDRLLVAECLAAGGDPRAPGHAEALRQGRAVEAEIVLGIWHWSGGRHDEAARHLAAAFREARVRPWTFPPLLERGIQLAMRLGGESPGRAMILQEALAEPFAVRLVDYGRLRARVELAQDTGRADLCASAFAPFEPHVPWEEYLLLRRFQCYRQTGNPLRGQALRDLEELRDNAPPRLSVLVPAASP
ncbi:MAG TPA: fused MFS/spermidine synthase [Thermoanaerobaculia bacterium]|nr:fused MFS/spermidine synthase [Thermoanaerobaculia bacterium]